MSLVLKIAQTSTNFEDPHDCTDAADVLTILNAVFDTLVKRKGRRFVPHLAESWSVSDDARNWRFRLRADVAFHDATPVGAKAVCANLHRLSQPDKGYALGSPGVWNQYLGTASFTALDALTVEIALTEPLADLLDVLVQAYMMSPACFDLPLTRRTIGSGPYRITQLDETMIRATANGAYFGGPPPHATVEWHAIAKPEDRLRQLQIGAVHIANRLPGGCDLAGLTPVPYMSPVAIIYLFNIASGPMQHPDLRRALNLAIDRKALISEVLNGAAVPLNGFISQLHFGADTDPEPPFDRPRARALLRKAGYGAGLTLTVSCPDRLPDEAILLTACLSAQLQTIGITLEVTVHNDREAYAHMVRRKEIGDLAVFDSSPLSTFRVIHEKLDARVAGAWWQGYQNPRVEQRIDAARRVTQPDAREEIYRQAYHEIARDPPWLFLYNPIRTLGLTGQHPEFTMPEDGVLDVTALPS